LVQKIHLANIWQHVMMLPEMTGTLLWLSILLPIASGIISLAIKNFKIRAFLVFFTAFVLIVSAVLFFTSIDLPNQYTPASYSFWEVINGVLYSDGSQRYYAAGGLET
jgi:hypothetical protein